MPMTRPVRTYDPMARVPASPPADALRRGSADLPPCVADAPVFPAIPNAPLHATVLAIPEHAADLITNPRRCARCGGILQPQRDDAPRLAAARTPRCQEAITDIRVA